MAKGGRVVASTVLHGFHHFICWILSFSCITLPIKPQAGTSHRSFWLRLFLSGRIFSCSFPHPTSLSLVFYKNSLSFFYPALYSPSFQSFQPLFLCLKLPVSYHQYSLHILISTHIYANRVCVGIPPQGMILWALEGGLYSLDDCALYNTCSAS